MYTFGLALALVAVVVTAFARPAAQGSIQTRLDETVKQAIAKSNGARFWVAYSIQAHHRIGVDEAVPESKGTVFKEGLRLSLRPASESKNVSVFLLYRGNRIEKMEIHDTDRYRTRDEYPVYSLGQVTNADSIGLLMSLLPAHSGTVTGERLVLAIGIHDDPQVAPTLSSIVNNSEGNEKERGAAAMWIGQVPGQKATLESLARNEDLPIEVRKQAIVGLGFSRYPDVLPILQNFYETFSDRELRQQALFAASHTINRSEATEFLMKVKNTDREQDFRQQATLWLQRLSASGN